MKKRKDKKGLFKAIWKVKKLLDNILYRKIKNGLGLGVDFLGFVVYTLSRGKKWKMKI